MRVLITGAGGMLGRDCAAAAEAAGHETVALTHRELDITRRGELVSSLRDAAPDVLINCAAYTDVDGAEHDPEGAHDVNAKGAGYLAGAASAAGAWTIHVSSDYVFDGRKSGEYTESDLAAPLSVYGASKLAGEAAVARAAPAAHTIVRSSWLFGAHGKCFPQTMIRLATERDELRVVDDQVGCPTFTGHLASGLVDLAERRLIGVVHCAAAGACSWFQFAREILSRAGSSTPVTPVSTSEFPRPASRPANSVLGSERQGEASALPDWREGLDAYLSATLSAR